MPDQTCTYRFLAGRCSQKRAGRKRGHPPPLVVSAADTRAGDGWRRFFSQCTPRPDLHTPIGLRGARKKGGRRRSTQGNGRQPGAIWRRRRSPPEKRALHRVTTLAGGQAGRAAAKPINVNPAAGKTHELLLCSAILSTFTLKIRWEQDWTCILPGNNDVTYPINSGERCGAGLLAG